MSNTRHSRDPRRPGFYAKPPPPVVSLEYLQAGARRLPSPEELGRIGSQRGAVAGVGELPGLIAPDARPGRPEAR
jgi:hypothetical protein